MALTESDLSELLDAFRAGRFECTGTRTNERNGSRPRLLATQAGDAELAIPKSRKGTTVTDVDPEELEQLARSLAMAPVLGERDRYAGHFRGARPSTAYRQNVLPLPSVDRSERSTAGNRANSPHPHTTASVPAWLGAHGVGISILTSMNGASSQSFRS